MNLFRGVFMLIAACVAFWQAWRLRATHFFALAILLGLLALALGLWHLTRKAPLPRE